MMLQLSFGFEHASSNYQPEDSHSFLIFFSQSSHKDSIDSPSDYQTVSGANMHQIYHIIDN